MTTSAKRAHLRAIKAILLLTVDKECPSELADELTHVAIGLVSAIENEQT